jgi:hypothetical protein
MCYCDIFQSDFIIGHNLRFMKVHSVIFMLPSSYNHSINLLSRSLFYLETALNVSGGNSTHHQERKQLYLQHPVFVTPLLLSAAIVEVLERV